MSLYDMNAVVVAADEVTSENMFDDFRTIQLFAMSIISAVEKVGISAPDPDRFDSRTIRENIPAGFQTRITPVAVPTDVDGEEIYMYEYDAELEIIGDGYAV